MRVQNINANNYQSKTNYRKNNQQKVAFGKFENLFDEKAFKDMFNCKAPLFKDKLDEIIPALQKCFAILAKKAAPHESINIKTSNVYTWESPAIKVVVACPKLDSPEKFLGEDEGWESAHTVQEAIILPFNEEFSIKKIPAFLKEVLKKATDHEEALLLIKAREEIEKKAQDYWLSECNINNFILSR